MLPPQERALYRKLSLHLLPILFVCYLLNYIDRINISFAKLTMSASLGISEAAYGFGAGLFFIGYFAFQVPSNLLLQRVGARRWIALIVLAWGLISAGTALITSEWQFYLIRFVLGAVEAGFFPGVILYLTWWYPGTVRARIVAWFITAIPVAGLLGGPLSGWIIEKVHLGNLESWQWLFILEGLPGLLVAWWVWKGLTDRPHQAAWLTTNEKALLEKILTDEAEARRRQGAPDKASAIFRLPLVWILCALYFCNMMGLYGLSFWLPQIIKGLGWTSPLQIGLMTAVPWTVAVIFMILWGSHSDRQQERRFHAAGAALLAGIGFALCGAVQHPAIGLGAAALAAAGVMGLMAVLWSLPGALLNGSAAAAGIALINSCGNLGGFVSPTLIGAVTESTGSNAAGQYLTAAFLIFAAITFVGLRILQPAAPSPSK